MMTDDQVNVTVKSVRAIRKLAYSIPELAKQTSICRNNIYAALNDGSLVGRKWGSRTIIIRTDAVRWLKSLPLYNGVSKP